MVAPSTSSDDTVLEAAGFHASSAAVVVCTAAVRLRAVAATVENDPPKYTIESAHAIALRPAFGAGFHGVAAPVSVSSAATLVRVCPPAKLNSPPAYTMPVL